MVISAIAASFFCLRSLSRSSKKTCGLTNRVDEFGNRLPSEKETSNPVANKPRVISRKQIKPPKLPTIPEETGFEE